MKNFLSFVAALFFLVTAVTGQNSTSGYVKYNNDESTPIQGAVLTLNNAAGVTISQTITDENGYYEFKGLAEGAYSISVVADLPEGGISPADASLIYSYLSGEGTLTPAQMVAADVDFNGTIDWNDLTLILEKYITEIDEFPISWIFDDYSFTINGNKDVSHDGGEIRGSCTGDVNGSYSPPQTKNNAPLINVNTNNSIFASSGSEFVLPVKFDQDIYAEGLGLIINYPSEYLQFLTVETSDPSIVYNVKDNKIYIAWRSANSKNLVIKAGEPVVNIHFKTGLNFSNGQVIELSLDNNSEIVNGVRNEGASPVMFLPKILGNSATCELSNVFPNPVKASDPYATFNYYIPAEGNVALGIYDMTGRRVSELYNGTVEEGNHTINFFTSQLGAGNYLINLNYKGYNNNVSISRQKFSVLN